MSFSRALCLLALSALFAACGDDDVGPRAVGGRCGSDGDCASGLLCEFRYCQQACSADVECPGAARCVKGLEFDDAGNARRVCQLGEHTACTRAVDCLGRQTCADGECRDECTARAQCASDQVCASNERCYSLDPNKDPVDAGS
ncbi:MAG TPA: hypothetical protein VI299_19285 [Polyangiales bacterium]